MGKTCSTHAGCEDVHKQNILERELEGVRSVVRKRRCESFYRTELAHRETNCCEQGS